MIVLDADLLVIDLRFPADARFNTNQRVLHALVFGEESLAVTCHTLLEVMGVVSFNKSASETRELPEKIPTWFALEVLPSPKTSPIHANCAVDALIEIMVQRSSIGDAIVLEQIQRFIPRATLFLSWNAKHFRGKLPCAVMTPEEWWHQRQP